MPPPKWPQVVLTPAELTAVIAEMADILPVYSYGESLLDFEDRFNRLTANELFRFTKCLRKLHRHADCAPEPHARECDRSHIEGR